jgi:hypothetical protein
MAENFKSALEGLTIAGGMEYCIFFKLFDDI